MNKFGGKKLQLKEVIKVDWSLAPIFNEYILNDQDKYFKFKEASNGALTVGQI